MHMVSKLARADDGIDSAGLDDRTGHSPECTGDAGQGTEYHQGEGKYLGTHGGLESKTND